MLIKKKKIEYRTAELLPIEQLEITDLLFWISLNQYVLTHLRIISFSRFQKVKQLKLTVLMSAFLNR